MLVLAPIIPPIVAGGSNAALYIASAVTGFLGAAWQSKIDDEGDFNNQYEEEYTKISENAVVMEIDLSSYEFEAKKTVDEKIAEFITNYQVPPQVVAPEKVNQNIPTKTGLIDVIKATNTESIEQQKILNNNLANLTTIMLKMFEAKNADLINQNKNAVVMKDNLLAINKSLATLATLPKVTAEVGTSSKSRSISVQSSSTTSTGSATAALETIASGVEDQKLTNEKIIESLAKKNDHLDFLKNGDENLKDSKGNQIKPREIKAQNEAEQHMDKKSLNTFDSQDLVDAIESISDDETDGIEALLMTLLSLDKTKFENELNQSLFKGAN